MRAKFRENKSLAKWRNHSVIYWCSYIEIMPQSRVFDVTYMSFNAIRENKILAKISEIMKYVQFCSSFICCYFLWLRQQNRPIVCIILRKECIFSNFNFSKVSLFSTTKFYRRARCQSLGFNHLVFRKPLNKYFCKQWRPRWNAT